MRPPGGSSKGAAARTAASVARTSTRGAPPSISTPSTCPEASISIVAVTVRLDVPTPCGCGVALRPLDARAHTRGITGPCVVRNLERSGVITPGDFVLAHRREAGGAAATLGSEVEASSALGSRGASSTSGTSFTGSGGGVSSGSAGCAGCGGAFGVGTSFFRGCTGNGGADRGKLRRGGWLRDCARRSDRGCRLLPSHGEPRWLWGHSARCRRYPRIP